MTYLLPSRYTAFQLIASLHFVKQSPTEKFRTPDGTTMTSEEYIRWFRKCLAKKIEPSRLNHRGEICRKTKSDYQTSLKRDSWRLGGYGGLGKILETPEIRARLQSDHVHVSMNGTRRLCSDLQCETRH